MLKPMISAISTIHLLELGLSALSYHMVMAQNTIAVTSEDIA